MTDETTERITTPEADSAENGFDVTCIDISKTAVEAIKKEVENKGIKIDAICADIDSYKILQNYDIIICTGTLHFVKDFRKLINEIKNHTNKKGINILDALIGEKFFKNREIKKIYLSWEIKDYEIHKEDFGKMEYLVAIK